MVVALSLLRGKNLWSQFKCYASKERNKDLSVLKTLPNLAAFNYIQPLSRCRLSIMVMWILPFTKVIKDIIWSTPN